MITLRHMAPKDWPQVRAIYQHGLDTGIATFESVLPTYAKWDENHLKLCRIVAQEDGIIAGWVALSPVSSRLAYAGVAEVSIYTSPDYQRRGAGWMLLNAAAEESERAGIWTLQSCIFRINEKSIKLHEKCGFRIVGYREKHARDKDNIWQDTVLMERRSKLVL